MTSTASLLPATAAELVALLELLPHPEGGFFRETFRSGAAPMASRGQTAFDGPAESLVVTTGRGAFRPDGDERRNCLTSIFWVPTRQSPVQPLVQNESDHVHYYQGGLPMEYTQYNPRTGTLETAVLGPDLCRGQVLQYAVRGGSWKCARLAPEAVADGAAEADYALLAEAVGPGFDFHDFHFVTPEELAAAAPPEVQDRLRPYLHGALAMAEIEAHYHSKEVQEAKAKERL